AGRFQCLTTRAPGAGARESSRRGTGPRLRAARAASRALSGGRALAQQPPSRIGGLDKEFGAAGVTIPIGFHRIEMEPTDNVGSLAVQQVAGESFVKGEVGRGWHGR